jgi:hypothetical protein
MEGTMDFNLSPTFLDELPHLVAFKGVEIIKAQPSVIDGVYLEDGIVRFIAKRNLITVHLVL